MVHFLGTRLLAASLLLLSPLAALAQQNANITGAVTDESKGVLPGVTVTATDLGTGRVASAVTDAQGDCSSVT